MYVIYYKPADRPTDRIGLCKRSFKTKAQALAALEYYVLPQSHKYYEVVEEGSVNPNPERFVLTCPNGQILQKKYMGRKTLEDAKAVAEEYCNKHPGDEVCIAEVRHIFKGSVKIEKRDIEEVSNG